MKHRIIVEIDTETNTASLIDEDGEINKGSGCMLLLGNNPAEGTCFNFTFGDMRAVAESFACLAGDENPRSRRVMAHIKERMHRKHISVEDALAKFEKNETGIFH